MSIYLNYNGEIMEADKPLITAGNRGFCYGDGLFETMKLWEGRIELAALHFERLFEGMHLLQFDIPDYYTPAYFEDQIHKLCEKNAHGQAVRIRLMVFRGEDAKRGTLATMPQYIIQTSDMSPGNLLNKDGLLLGPYSDARKSIDKFSHLKSNNYQPYTLAAIYAKQNAWDDCLVMNSDNFICESSIANIFIIKKGTIITPSLAQGCVAGVMRRNLLLKLPKLGYKVSETAVSIEMIKEADEIFLTNAIRGIRWVGRFENIIYTNEEITLIHNAING